jgi:sensor histidine kinase YesM
MKVRWREHEMIFVTILVVAQIIVYSSEIYTPSNARLGFEPAARFKENGIPFVYWRNVLMPQIFSVLLVYSAYLAINLLILPQFKKITFDDFEKMLSIKTLKAILSVVIVAYLLALGINICSFYGRPHLLNYSGFQFLSLPGYNDMPMTNLFFGFDRSLAIIFGFSLLFALRELIIWFINKPDANREYRVLISNNATPLMFVYFIVLLVINPVHYDFLLYVACITPLFFLYIYSTFWVFPSQEKNSLLQRALLSRLLVATIISTIPVMIVLGIHRKPLLILFYWIFLLFVVIPTCWLLYQQRREKILQLRGMETALAKSTADLQFLRSQINPHFLFNALNTLYGTALKERSEHTAEGIQRLGDMMRFMLHENNLDFIPMNKEIEYLRNYIALQKIRTQSSPDILIEDNIDEATCNRTIAPMLLIPFVENAFKHGISLNEKSWIRIMLECSDETINFEVRNSVHSSIESDTEQEGPGIGLINVRDRLKLLYPGRHELRIGDDKNEFVARLVITGN